MKKPNLKLSTALFTVLLSIWLVITTAIFIQLYYLTESNEWVDHTDDVLYSIEETLSLIKDVQVGYRGYLLTEDSSYLQPFLDAHTKVDSSFRELEQLTSDNDIQQANLQELEKYLIIYLDEVDSALIYVRNNVKDLTPVWLERNKGLIDSVYIWADVVKTHEEGLLVTREEEQETFSSISPALLLVLSIFSLSVLILLYYIQRKDIERRIQLMQELETQVFQLKNKNDVLEQYAYITSHHLQEPLRKIQIHLDLLETYKGDDPELKKNITNKLKRIASYQRSLLNSLVNYVSVIDENSAQVEEIDLNETFEQLADNYEDEHTHIQYHNLPTVQADKYEMLLLFDSIIDNSVKYKKDDVDVQIQVNYSMVDGEKVKYEGGYLPTRKYHKISITDNGKGFSVPDTNKVFHLFSRMRSDDEGSGIGLAVCKKIADKYNGYIEANSYENLGTTITVYLPA